MSALNQSSHAAGRAILTVALCCLVAMMEGVDLQAPGLTIPVLGPLFKMSPADKGWFLSASTFGLMLGAAVGGRLSDLIGRKWVLILSTVLFGLFAIATVVSTSAQMLMAMRFLTGLGLGGALPNVVALAAESISPAKRHTAIGFLYAGLPIGGGSASLIAALAAAPSQWPVVYLVGGFAPLIVAPLLIWLLPGRGLAPPDGAPVKLDLVKVLTPAPRTNQSGGALKALFGEGRAPSTLLLWVGFFCLLVVQYLLLGWLPSLMRSRGLSPAHAFMVQVGFNWFGALGSIATGLVLDRGRREVTVAVVFGATCATLAYLAVAPGEFVQAVLAGSLVGATISGAQAVLYSLAPSCYPTAVRGTGVGFAVAVGRLGSAGGPILAAYLIGAGHSAGQVLGALTPIITVSAVAAVLVSLRVKGRAEAAV